MRTWVRASGRYLRVRVLPNVNKSTFWKELSTIISMFGSHTAISDLPAKKLKCELLHFFSIITSTFSSSFAVFFSAFYVLFKFRLHSVLLQLFACNVLSINHQLLLYTLFLRENSFPCCSLQFSSVARILYLHAFPERVLQYSSKTMCLVSKTQQRRIPYVLHRVSKCNKNEIVVC